LPDERAETEECAGVHGAVNIVAKGWFWGLDYLYVSYWQVREAVFRADPARYADPHAVKPPILLLPGIFETWQFLRPLADQLSESGHPVHVVTGLGRNSRTVAASSPIVENYLREHDLRDVTIVAHSKGGLIGKYVMAKGDREGRISRMVAIATPFSGSAYARYVLVRSLRDFSPRDATTLMLGELRSLNERITSIYGIFDPHIPGGSALPGATNVRLDVAGHFRILGDRRLRDAVARAVDQPAS